MTNRQTGKYFSIIALHNDAAKNSLWRSTSALTFRTNNSNSGDRKGKGASFTSSFKKSNGSNGNFNKNGNKDLYHYKNGLSLRMVLLPLRVLLSQLALTRPLNAKSPLQISRLSLGTKLLSPTSLRRNATSAAELTLVLIVGRLEKSCLSVLNRNLDVSRVM
jgi:hypothetical protein